METFDRFLARLKLDLTKLEPRIRAFAKRHKLKFKSRELGAPGMDLFWKKDGILRFIRVTGDPRHRILILSNAVDEHFKKGFSSFRGFRRSSPTTTLSDILANCHSVLSKLSIKDLTDEVNIRELPR